MSTALSPAVAAWNSAEIAGTAPNDQGDPSDWGVPHPPTQDTTVAPSMPAGYSHNPLAESLDYYGFESDGRWAEDTPRAMPGPHGTAANNSGPGMPWNQEPGTRVSQADNGGPWQGFHELMPNAGVETGTNITTMSTDNTNLRNPDGTLQSFANGHIANDIQAPRNRVSDFGIWGRMNYSERPVFNNVAIPAASLNTAEPNAFTPFDVTPANIQMPSSVATVYQDVPDPLVNQTVSGNASAMGAGYEGFE